MILELIFFVLAVICYAVSQAVVHGEFNLYGGAFWGIEGWELKYEYRWSPDDAGFVPAPNTWYYRWFKIKYKERFPLSATLFVFVTDAYHLFQALFFLFLSLLFSFAIGFTWWIFLLFYTLIHIVHFISYRYVQR